MKTLKRKWAATMIVAAFAITTAMTTTPEQLEGIGTALSAVWRGSGNTILFLDSDIMSGKSVGIDFSEEPYPYPPQADDPGFYTKNRIDTVMGGDADLSDYRMLCGKLSTEAQRTTTLVFWSQNYWEGSKQQISCGGGNAASHEIAGVISGDPQSFCLVTNLSSPQRRGLCINGPRCDDGRRNGNESDVDCGGSCGRCGEGRMCGVTSDCLSGSACLSGRCRAPTCNDGIRNGSESDIDCGGSCSSCAIGRSCSSNSHCQSGNCQSGTCQALPTCNGTPATASAQNWNVLVELINSCGAVSRQFANSLNDAKQCATNTAAVATAVPQVCGFYVQVDSNWEAYIEAPSSSKAIQCARNTLCSNCTMSVTQTLSCVSQ